MAHVGLLPQEFPLPVLAAFFHLHTEPEPWIRRLLARWLWRGWVHGFGTSGQTPALRRAVLAVNPHAGDEQFKPSAYEAVQALLTQVSDEGASPLSDDTYRSKDRGTRLALLALFALGPCDGSGAPVDAASFFDAPATGGVGQLVRGHRSHLGNRGFWPVASARLTGGEPGDVLASHAVEPGAAELLVAGDIDGFLDRRAATVRSLLASFLTVKLDVGAAVRPPLDDFLIADADADEPGDAVQTALASAHGGAPDD